MAAHWSTLPDINRHFGACRDGWNAANLSQYRTPEAAYKACSMPFMPYAIRGLFSRKRGAEIWKAYDKHYTDAQHMRGFIAGMGYKPNFAALRRKFPSIPKEPK